MSAGQRLLLLLCLIFAVAVFVPGINWGLPSRDADDYLFGGRTAWTGAQILALAPISDDPTRGADVDANPLADRDRLIVLNATEEQRAEIVRRYRLFTHQPDEYNTLKSLSGMKPSELQLDPKMYQYGGLWIYPIGGLIKVILNPRSDVAHYLDHPEEFSKLYIVARAYSAMWGVIGAAAVYFLARKLAGAATPAAVAALCWVCMPAVVTMAHEAKPHLAGLVLMLLAILAASRYVETGSTRWSVIAGVLCGAATGMVLSAAIIFAIAPLMTLARPVPWAKRIRTTILAGVVGILVYAITNPYVPINLFRNPAVLRSNLGTSKAMYDATAGSGVVNALQLIAEGASLPLALVGALGLLVLLTPRLHRALSGGAVPLHLVWLIAGPGLIVAAMFVALARGKPAEYARFALLPDTALCIAAVTFPWLLLRSRVGRAAMLLLLFVGVALPGGIYLAHFIDDSFYPTTRVAEAKRLSSLWVSGMNRLALTAEPAPYNMPPVDLWAWRIALLPRGVEPMQATREAGAHVLLRPVDRYDETVPAGFIRLEPITPKGLFGAPSPITWAAKPFEVLVAPASPPSSSAQTTATP